MTTGPSMSRLCGTVGATVRGINPGRDCRPHTKKRRNARSSMKGSPGSTPRGRRRSMRAQHSWRRRSDRWRSRPGWNAWTGACECSVTSSQPWRSRWAFSAASCPSGDIHQLAGRRLPLSATADRPPPLRDARGDLGTLGLIDRARGVHRARDRRAADEILAGFAEPCRGDGDPFGDEHSSPEALR